MTDMQLCITFPGDDFMEMNLAMRCINLYESTAPVAGQFDFYVEGQHTPLERMQITSIQK